MAFEARAELRDTRGFISITKQLPVVRIHSKLDVRTSRLHSHLADHRNRSIPHALVFPVRQGLSGRDRDRIAGMHSHRIKNFSIEQMMTTLSLRSRITSNSNSFHPITDRSINT